MAFTPLTTASTKATAVKCLMYGHHGWGKTTQAKHMQRKYGRGFIISGEAGLLSVQDEPIDYLPFTSYEGKGSSGTYSFRDIQKIVESPDFKAQDYKWVMLDSLTELSDRMISHFEDVHKGSKNGFQLWGDYGRAMLADLKWFRDLPYHVVVTCLAKEETNDNGETEYWPSVKGSAVQKQIPGIFDMVLCGVRKTEGDPSRSPVVKRFIVTDEVKGWHGKVRDPHRRIKPFVETGDVTEVFDLVLRTPEEQRKYEEAMRVAEEAIAKARIVGETYTPGTP
jgi:hypothetical protein